MAPSRPKSVAPFDPDDLPALIRVGDVARWLGIQPVRVRELIGRGYLRASKPPGMRDYLIRKAEVESYIAEGERLVAEAASSQHAKRRETEHT